MGRRFAGFVAAAVLFGQPLARAQEQHGPERAATSITHFIRGSGARFIPEQLPAWIMGDDKNAAAAYETVYNSILQKEVIGGDDWRIGLDALCVLVGTHPTLDDHILEKLREFANDANYFGETRHLAGSPGSIDPAGAAAKMEVPWAVAFLAQAAVEKDPNLSAAAEVFLTAASKTDFWKVEWSSQSFWGHDENAKHLIEASLARSARESLEWLRRCTPVHYVPHAFVNRVVEDRPRMTTQPKLTINPVIC
jgi:hypothetical protein